MATSTFVAHPGSISLFSIPATMLQATIWPPALCSRRSMTCWMVKGVGGSVGAWLGIVTDRKGNAECAVHACCEQIKCPVLLAPGGARPDAPSRCPRRPCSGYPSSSSFLLCLSCEPRRSCIQTGRREDGGDQTHLRPSLKRSDHRLPCGSLKAPQRGILPKAGPTRES